METAQEVLKEQVKGLLKEAEERNGKQEDLLLEVANFAGGGQVQQALKMLIGSGFPISIKDAPQESMNMRGKDGSQAGNMDRRREPGPGPGADVYVKREDRME